VSYGFGATATPSKAGYTFNPASRTYSNVTANQSTQGYTATLQTFTISGRIVDGSGAAVSGVTLSGLPGNPVTDATGDYTATVSYGFGGTVTPSKAGYTFNPVSRTYSNVTANQSTQGYTATLQTFTVSGRVVDGSGAAVSGVTLGGLPGNPVTNATGDYTATVSYGFGGTATPSKAGYTFNPASRTYSNVTANQSNQGYTGTLQTFAISGHVVDGSGNALSGVTISGLPGNPQTNASGDYSATVSYGFSGTATPSKAGYTFAPASRTYSNVTANQASQGYTATLQTFTISGRIVDGSGAAVSGVTLGGLPGNPVTNASGDYIATVNYGFSGTVTPSKAGCTFNPVSRTYSNVTANQASQGYTATSGGGGPLPMTTASRTSGVAPLAVFFDAVDTASPAWTSNVVQPADGDYASYYYAWDFGDDPAATWSTNGKSKNTAIGYVAAHVYEEPGTYGVALVVTDAAGGTHTYTQTITVQAFSGTTYYVSSSGGNDNNDGLSTSTPFQSFSKGMSKAATNRQILLKRGDTWTVSNGPGGTITAAGPGILGAYGSGAAPVIRVTTTGETGLWIQGNDWRLVDLELVGPGVAGDDGAGIRPEKSGGVSRFLALRCRVSYFRVNYGGSLGDGVENCIADCDFGHSLINGVYASGNRLSFIGCNIHDNQVSHCLRITHTVKCALSSNSVTDPAGDRHALKLHNDLGSADHCQYIYISDNDFAGGSWTVTVGPQDSGSDERIRQVVIDSNLIRSEGTPLLVWAQQVCVRNNLLVPAGAPNEFAGITIATRGIEPPPDLVSVYNNTIYAGNAGTGEFRGIQVASGTNIVLRNNLISDPVWNGYYEMDIDNSVPVTKDHNLWTDTPQFINATNGDFRLQQSSPAVNQGVFLFWVHQDYDRAPRPSTNSYDLGAFENW
jgi:hypothetical protein